MIDSNSIIVQQENKSNVINVSCMNEFADIPCYDLADEKDYKRYISTIESVVRKSYEYKIFIKYLRENFGFDRCAFLANVANEESYNVSIEVHHAPYTLYDIATIVVRKRQNNNESLSVYLVAEEIIKLHYQFLVGLIPLSETVHQLVHSGRLFIPTNKILGRYKVFTDIYYPFIDPEMLDTLKMNEKASEENSEVNDTTILNTNRITYNITDKRYQLPQIGEITDDMMNRIETIKSNNYILPTVNEVKQIEAIKNKPLRKVIRFIDDKVE